MFVLKNCGFCSRKFLTKTGFELHLSVKHGFKSSIIKVHRNPALVEELKSVTADDVTRWSSDDEGSVTVWPEKRRRHRGIAREVWDEALGTFSVTQKRRPIISDVTGIIPKRSGMKFRFKTRSKRTISRSTPDVTFRTEEVKQLVEHSAEDETELSINFTSPVDDVTSPVDDVTSVKNDSDETGGESRTDDSVTQQPVLEWKQKKPKRRSEPLRYADLYASSSDADSDSDVDFEASENSVASSDSDGSCKGRSFGSSKRREKKATTLKSERVISEEIASPIKFRPSTSELGIIVQTDGSVARQQHRSVTSQSRLESNVSRKSDKNCSTCGRHLATKERRDYHFRKGDQCPNICKKCGLAFPSFRQLNLHVFSVHDKKKLWSCEFCGQQFTSNLGRRQHIQVIHDRSKPLRCNLCDMNFGQKANLDIHLKGTPHREKLAASEEVITKAQV